jgi:hypothetical protein
MDELVTISSLKNMQLTIHEVTKLDEIKRLIDQSEALKGYAQAQKLSCEIQNDIVEYHLYATRQMGAISAALEKSVGGRPSAETSPERGLVKKDVLAKAGIDIRRANEAEKLAAIPDAEFDALIVEKRDADKLTKTARPMPLTTFINQKALFLRQNQKTLEL